MSKKRTGNAVHAKITKWGNSAGVRFQKQTLFLAGLDVGDPVIIEADRGVIRITRQTDASYEAELIKLVKLTEGAL